MIEVKFIKQTIVNQNGKRELKNIGDTMYIDENIAERWVNKKIIQAVKPKLIKKEPVIKEPEIKKKETEDLKPIFIKGGKK
jgi:hypothetical protein